MSVNFLRKFCFQMKKNSIAQSAQSTEHGAKSKAQKTLSALRSPHNAFRPSPFAPFPSFLVLRFSLLALLLILPVWGMDGNELLQKVDGYRKMSNSFSLKIKISDYNDVKLKEEAVFFGCFKGNNKSVMICTKGKNKNMKVLMKDENMWVNIGRSKRAMRITPMQRLLGQASNGDVAKVAFSQDYNGEIKKITNDFYILELDAKNNGATYQKIILYVKKIITGR